MTPNPYCRWQWVGQCQKNLTKRLGVLNECCVIISSEISLIGLLITELDERRSGVRWRKRRRCPGTKRVPGQSRLTLRCHNATNIREREREKEKETIKKVPNKKYNKIYRIEGAYAWECMNMWHANINSSWAQPNPNLSAHSIATNIAHIYNAWKYCYNANVMQCMKF